jgi:hypothetical protein
MSPTKAAGAARPNRLAATFAAGTNRPAPPLEDTPVVEPAPAPAPVAVLTVPQVTTPQLPGPQPQASVGEGSVTALPTPALPAAPGAANTAAPAKGRAVCVARVKQTVELPEDVYESVQDFARGHRTSFQILIRSLLDDLLAAEDHKHRARVAGLIAAAEKDKRSRRRRPA